MELIGAVTPTRAGAVSSTRPGTRAGRRFTLGAASPDETRAAGAPEAPGGLLSLQEIEPHRDVLARRHGTAMLRALAAVQCGLLDGDPAGALAELAALVEAVPQADDAGLTAALGGVVLRARVELARGGHGAANSLHLGKTC